MKPRILVTVLVIVGAVSYLAFLGFKEGKTYYRTCDEVAAMGNAVINDPIRMAGIVVAGSIRREGKTLLFDLEYEGARYPVRYDSDEPVPDTFKDGVQAVVDGRLTSTGVFEGRKIQAKCASKYEADYNTTPNSTKTEAKTTA
jgi:cytochrome c-type biogenesis protein CcmE